ncbi:hypothetical protein pdam_00018968 [Pocillopora damicornis]|uniref:Replication protein A C-terminal domain-containing protein n=1 Tax=Pocillopora damicornis TaxID=46731 RepID=A0A3M6TMZ9_POCDA|nr:hypothetical protein pdam_00018968 [Pocillopora damicornis]
MWNDTNQFGGGYQSMDTGFGGGGYMQDAGGFGSPMTDSQEKKRSPMRAQSILPCSIKQLHSATYNQTEDAFKLGNIELNQVSVVGVIRDAQESATNIMYTINDMTGEDIIVRKWLENEFMKLLLIDLLNQKCCCQLHVPSSKTLLFCVLDTRMITSCQHEEGMSVAEIKQKVRTSEQQIRSTLEWLSNEGHIYSTIDDDHFRSTDSY